MLRWGRENNKILKELYEKKCSRCSVFIHADAQPMRMEHADAQPIRMLDIHVDVKMFYAAWRAFCEFLKFSKPV